MPKLVGKRLDISIGKCFDKSGLVLKDLCRIVWNVQGKFTVGTQLLKIKGCVCRFFCLDAHFILGMAVCNGFVCAWLSDPFSYIIVISPDSVDESGIFFEFF